MDNSGSIKEISKALADFQKKMPILRKNSNVNMTLKNGRKVEYDYIELGELVKQTHKLLSESGLSIIQPISTHEGKPTLFTILMHGESGEWIRSWVHLDYEKIDYQTGQPIKMNEQEKAGVQTYNSRYGYVGMLRLGLIDEDDDAVSVIDQEPRKKLPNKADELQTVNEEQIKQLYMILAKKNYNVKHSTQIISTISRQSKFSNITQKDYELLKKKIEVLENNNQSEEDKNVTTN